MMPDGGPGLAAVGRSAAAAGGALVGALIAVPVGSVLFVFLFERVGEPVIVGIISGATQDVSGIAAILVWIMVAVAAVTIAITLVAALVTPVFVLLPLAATAAALRLTRAGLIVRTLWLMLAIGVGLTLVTEAALAAADARPSGWVWGAVLLAAAFSGRLVVELWRPDRAGTPDGPFTLGRRWRRAGIVWLGTMLIAAVVVAYVLFFAEVGITDAR